METVLEYLKAIPMMVGISPFMGLYHLLSLVKLDHLLDKISVEVMGILVIALTVVLGLCIQSFWPGLIPLICVAVGHFLAQ